MCMLAVYVLNLVSCTGIIFCALASLSSYGTPQMQLHSRARVSSKALEGLLKVTCNKIINCVSARDSQPCRVLLA